MDDISKLAKEYAEMHDVVLHTLTNEAANERKRRIHEIIQIVRVCPVQDALLFAKEAASFTKHSAICDMLTVLTNRVKCANLLA